MCELWIRSAEPPGVHRLTTAEQYFRKFFKSDEKHKVQDSNEVSYTFKKTNKSMPDSEVADSSKLMLKSGTEKTPRIKNFQDRG